MIRLFHSLCFTGFHRRFRPDPFLFPYTKQAALIDKMLLGEGSTIHEISKALSMEFGKGVRPPHAFDSRVKFHLGHLEKTVRANMSEQDPHGLPLLRSLDGKVAFAKDPSMEVSASKGMEGERQLIEAKGVTQPPVISNGSGKDAHQNESRDLRATSSRRTSPKFRQKSTVDLQAHDGEIERLVGETSLGNEINNHTGLVLPHGDARSRESVRSMIRAAVGHFGGVYAYFEVESGTCLYVGKAMRLYERILCHYDESIFVPSEGRLGLLGDKKKGLYPAFFRDTYGKPLQVKWLRIDDERKRLIAEQILHHILEPVFIEYKAQFKRS